MSWHAYKAPECVQQSGSIALVIKPHPRDLGGFQASRVLLARRIRYINAMDHRSLA